MPIYWGRRLIKNRGDSGVYYGNRKIKFVYFGNRLVYSYESYDPNTVLVDVTNGGSKTLELLPGVYQIKMAGGGGNPVTWVFQGYAWALGGGGGASIEGNFYLETSATFSCTAGAAKQASVVKLNGNNLFVCNQGTSPSAGGSNGQGGTATIGSDVENLSLVGKTGNNARGGNVTTGGASVSSKKWGAGKDFANSGELQYGGIEIVYLRRWK